MNTPSLLRRGLQKRDKHQSSRFDLTELKRLAKLARLSVPGVAPLPERDPQHPLHPHRHDTVWYDLKSNLAADEDYIQCWTVLIALQQRIEALALDLDGAAHVLGASPDRVRRCWTTGSVAFSFATC